MSGTVPNVTFTFTDNAQYSYSFAVTATVGTSTLTSDTSAAVNSTTPGFALDLDTSLILWLKFKSGDINATNGVITNYGVTKTSIGSLKTLGYVYGDSVASHTSVISTSLAKYGSSSLYQFNGTAGTYSQAQDSVSRFGVLCNLTMPANISISFWMYLPSGVYGGGFQFLLYNPASNGGFMANIDGKNGVPPFDYGGIPISTGNAWHHVVLTWDGTTQRIYVDNAAKPNGTNGELNMGMTPFITGNWYDLSFFGDLYRQYVAGYFADLRIYNRVLSSTEVTSLYNYAPTGY